MRSGRLIAYVLGVAAAVWGGLAEGAMPRLRVEGGRVVDPAGKGVVLRGVNLGNWLLIEPGGLGGTLGKWPDQYTLFETLRERFGREEQERLIGLYRDHYIAARDFEEMRPFGFNLLRVGFEYSMIEEDEHPKVVRAGAWKYLDWVVDQAERNGMYVLMDLHGAQERQVDGKQSGRKGYNRFWDDAGAQERSLWLWGEVARRYRGRTNVLGYEPLNEPWGKTPDALRGYCERWYPVMRAADPEAVAVMPGWWRGLGSYRTPADEGWANVMFDAHFYPGQFGWGKPDLETHRGVLTKTLPEWSQKMEAMNSTLLVGEFNIVSKKAGGGEMTRRYLDEFVARGWAYTFWTWKELRVGGGVHENMWMLATNRDPLAVVDVGTASAGEIEGFMKSLSTMPLVVDEDMLRWMTTKEKPSPLPAVGD